ncbi:cobyrinate a,c-diamide synthase [Streptomyces tsukubensis]|uniref:Hydrogenobyrinate a,c-diamide synthase n=2 Tax=Streptomyces TaxID=1883 RepID=A0A7G3UJ45_STRT9|nr:cobyrinate a,c-diamide synthase [Streptomyces tsukubensis]AZK93471.1 cobyrinic acid a,c-diamide synthase [Streptomyces tsukubensis]QKM70376.1 cobyrinate a,c-diamide synthase [Streptomyces tsukubensis NRRL18488]TAI45638.1 cobyrinate a,c-diamide synthase [Streptomyces tsukubensis]
MVARLVVAAPSSGSGKTTVATGLMAAFAGAGLAVSPHKVGPDYIDPGYHALATGRPGRNLDAYLCGPELVEPLFRHGAEGCDLAVVEGVMGLYDGASGLGELASTAQVAKLLRAPVVLVVDASSQSRSVAALAHGFISFDPEVRIGGIILNKVGSPRHEELLRDALEAVGVPVLGALPRGASVATPSRHLGLVPTAERTTEAVEAVAAMAALVREHCDLPGLLALARSAPALSAPAWSPVPQQRTGVVSGVLSGVASGAEPTALPRARGRVSPDLTGAVPGGAGAAGPAAGGPARASRAGRAAGTGPVVAVAGGVAFTFGYTEHTELLRAYGAEVVTFDPVRDTALPEGTAGIVIGGGFPEVYAEALSANEPMRRAVAEFARGGGPVAAECAGLLYLTRSLDGLPMCGVLGADARMTQRLTLGYREAVAVGDSVLAAAGTRIRGHEFHRTVVEPGTGASPAWGLLRPERRTEGFVHLGVHASYLHTHWAAVPAVAARFVERCAR